MSSTLEKKRILKLLELLNTKLSIDDVRGELYLMGGAVMCLAFNARPSTRDVDGYFKPKKAIGDAAREIAAEEGLNTDWLNDAVKGFLNSTPSFDSYLELSHLKIFTATPEYLLAMKCLAMRLGAEFEDENDVRFLLRYLNIQTYDQAIETIQKFYPIDRFPQKTLYALEELVPKEA